MVTDAVGPAQTFSEFENLIGNVNTDNFTLAGGNVTGTIDGNGGADSLTGDNVITTWTISGTDAGSVAGTVTGSVGAFTDIDNLTGNASVDTFAFTGAGLLTGAVDGAGGSADVLDVSGSASAVTISLADSSATTILNGGLAGGFSGIESFTGDAGGAGDDVLQGTAGTDIFTTSSANSGDVDGVIFTAFENLDGLGGQDVFNLGHDIDGTVDAGDNADAVNLTAGVAIGTLTGGSG